MHEKKDIRTTATLKTEGDDAGTLEAVISTFDVVDRDGDIVLASAFTDGEAIPMVWSHDWQMPIGKGVIQVTDKHAIFKGRLNLNTDWGRNAYESIKFMGPLQEYSWGFQILDSDTIERDGEKHRAIKATERFEASPVLVGAAGRDRTGTMSIKAAASTEALPFADHALAVIAHEATFQERVRARADMRERKEGRPLSAANRQVLTDHIAGLRTMAGELEAFLTALDPPKAAPALRAAALRQVAELTVLMN